MANVTAEAYAGTQVASSVPGSSAPAGASRAWNGGVEWQGTARCAANWGECGAPRLKTGELCNGHQRQLDKKNKELAGEQG